MSKSIPLSQKHGVNPSMMQCFWCGEVKAIALLGKLPDDKEAPRMAVYDYEPCDKCALLMAQGITLMEADEQTKKPTGRWVVVTRESLDGIIADESLRETIKRHGKCYVPVGIFTDLLPKEEPHDTSECTSGCNDH